MIHKTRDVTDIREKGAIKNGVPQVLSKRLYVQLLVFTGCEDVSRLTDYLEDRSISGALYKDINDPKGVGLITMNDNPDFFVTELRNIVAGSYFKYLTPKPEYTMLGRTYSMGIEQDLEDWLLRRPKRVALNPDWTWAIWYPLGRNGKFSQLSREEQVGILREHGAIGHAFGDADIAHDVRLSTAGLDKNNNDFMIGLIGKDLYPLSAIVQAMRKTVQTSTYINQMGPFFAGKTVWQKGYIAGF